MALEKQVEFAVSELPKKGLLSSLPSSWVPYAELVRIHKPVGILYIYFPYLFGCLFAACLLRPIPPITSIILPNVLLLVIATIYRGIGCNWNDIVDQDLDRRVERCRSRPLARRAVSTQAACAFMAAQYVVLFAIMAVFSPSLAPYMIPAIVTCHAYPFAKRITSNAQVVLGIALSMGMIVGCAAAGLDPLSLGTSDGIAFLCLGGSYVMWTLVYDTVYAFQDIEDDKVAGVKSMAIAHEHHMKPFLLVSSALQIGLLAATGIGIRAGLAYFIGVYATAILLLVMIVQVDLHSSGSCGRWFKMGSLMVGGALTFSLAGEYFSRLMF